MEDELAVYSELSIQSRCCERSVRSACVSVLNNNMARSLLESAVISVNFIRCYLQVSQVAPDHPGQHSHEKSLIWSLQTPPCRQGFNAQSLMSRSKWSELQSWKTNRKCVWQTKGSLGSDVTHLSCSRPRWSRMGRHMSSLVLSSDTPSLLRIR